MIPALVLAAFAAAQAGPYAAGSMDHSLLKAGIESAGADGEGVDAVLYDSGRLYVYSKEKLDLPATGKWKDYTVYETAHGARGFKPEQWSTCSRRLAFVDMVLEGRAYAACAPYGTTMPIEANKQGLYDGPGPYAMSVVRELARAQAAKKKLKPVEIEAYGWRRELEVSAKMYPAHAARLKARLSMIDSPAARKALGN